MQCISERFNYYPSQYDNFISLGNFNVEMSNSHIQDFCSVFNQKNLLKKPVCFKTLERPTGTDHILTNHTKFL